MAHRTKPKKPKKAMFSIENLKKAGVTLVVVLAALAIHQKFIAPRISAQKKA